MPSPQQKREFAWSIPVARERARMTGQMHVRFDTREWSSAAPGRCLRFVALLLGLVHAPQRRRGPVNALPPLRDGTRLLQDRNRYVASSRPLLPWAGESQSLTILQDARKSPSPHCGGGSGWGVMIL